MDLRTELQSVLHHEIPLTKDIGIRVDSCSSDRIVLRAPLEPNINHKCTAFGGSLYSVAVLCGWGFIYTQLKLNNLQGHIVIQHSEADYRVPVDGDIVASCDLTDSETLQRFITQYKKRGVARLKLEVQISFNNQEAVIFKGKYVVHH